MHSKITYWMESGMDSDVSDHLEPDEMYLMLHADMVSIKRQENALSSEIIEITSKFKCMLENVGLESDFPIHHPSTPTFMRGSTCSFTQVSPLPASSEDELLQQMMGPPLCFESTSSGSYEDSAMTLDDNSNYITSPKCFPRQPDNIAMNVPNITELSSSDISNNTSGSSDCYPKSTESSSDDNQCVPECLDLEQELVSRMQCYGDFTIDRQRKINDMSVRLTSGQSEPVYEYLTSAETEELFTREVEGCEDADLIPPPVVRVGPVIGSSFPDNSQRVVSSGATSSGTDCSSPPSSSSSSHHRRRHRRLSSRTSSSQGSRKSSSIPCASSTMIEDFSPPSSVSSGSSKHKSSSIPCASSTMIEDSSLPVSKPSSAQCSSEEDLQSIYTWSIHDSGDCSLEESYMKNFNGNHLVSKPPLPHKRVLSSSSASSRRSSKCDTDKLVILSDSCALPGIDALSVIEPSASYRDNYPGVESMYEEEHPLKSNSLPRTSTRINLLVNKSNGSSMEARRASLPDILSVCTPYDRSVPQSSDSSDNADDSSPLQERLELPGKSSSSSSHVSPPLLTSAAEVLYDSILTDSPTSVSSSGVFVPCNTPNPSDNSKHSQSTNSDHRSEARAAPSSLPLEASASAPNNSPKIFKIPKNTTPLRKLFRFKRSKGKNNLVSSTPNHGYPSSVRSDPISKRTLFPFANKGSQESVQLLDKKAVIKKFKRFSASFKQRNNNSGLTRIHTLANL